MECSNATDSKSVSHISITCGLTEQFPLRVPLQGSNQDLLDLAWRTYSKVEGLMSQGLDKDREQKE